MTKLIVFEFTDDMPVRLYEDGRGCMVAIKSVPAGCTPEISLDGGETFGVPRGAHLLSPERELAIFADSERTRAQKKKTTQHPTRYR